MANNVTDSTFDKEVLKSDLPVLVDFWAPWCGPCRIVGPTIETLGKEYSGKVKVVKVDVQDNQGIAMKFGIRSIPTVTLFKGGRAMGSLIGARAKGDYEKLIKKAF
ncbi:MAG: thioredoxin [Deltaproteobacteria bacterium]|nr:thioredoxin [Deltaproteobacteria bacterium]